jgi:hypothetical protein
MYKHFRGEGGELAEEDYLGCIDAEKYQQELVSSLSATDRETLWTPYDKKMLKELGKPKYIDEDKAYALIREWQKNNSEINPLNPEKIFARLFRQKVEEGVRKELGDLKIDGVLYYTSCCDLRPPNCKKKIKTPLDWHKGVDAFIDVIINDQIVGGLSTLTVDGTMMDKPGWKADMLIRFYQDDSYGPSDPKFIDFVEQYAKTATDLIVKKIRGLTN